MQTVAFACAIAVAIIMIGEWLKTRSSLMPVAVIFLILFFGIRTDYGNDFEQYKEMYAALNHRALGGLASLYPDVEMGWKILCASFRGVDFQIFVFCMTVVQFSTIGWFINKYVDRRYQALILAIYLFWPHLMITQLSMMRQSLAMSIVMTSIPYVLSKKWIKAELIIILAIQFHTSAYVALPLPMLIYANRWNQNLYIAFFIFIFALIYTIPESFQKLITSVLEYDKFEHYDFYIKNNEEVELRSGAGYLMQVLFCIYLFWILRWKSTGNRFFLICFAIYCMSLPLTGVVGQIGRLSMYYMQIGLAAFQPLIKRVRHDPMAMVFFIFWIFFIVYSYLAFFVNPIWIKKFMTYQTILN